MEWAVLGYTPIVCLSPAKERHVGDGWKSLPLLYWPHLSSCHEHCRTALSTERSRSQNHVNLALIFKKVECGRGSLLSAHHHQHSAHTSPGLCFFPDTREGAQPHHSWGLISHMSTGSLGARQCLEHQIYCKVRSVAGERGKRDRRVIAVTTKEPSGATGAWPYPRPRMGRKRVALRTWNSTSVVLMFWNADAEAIQQSAW